MMYDAKHHLDITKVRERERKNEREKPTMRYLVPKKK